VEHLKKKKIKVVWICHFTNEEVQSLLQVRKNENEFAPWIPNFLKGFENIQEVEIHVIAPHNYLRRETKLILRNIHYYFIPFGIPFLHRHWPHFIRFDVYTNFYLFRRRVKLIVKEIKPDLIHLIGAENSYYSTTALDLKVDYPILIFIQGFISEFNDEPNQSFELKNRIKIEEKILKSFKYFCGEQDSSTYLLKYNPDHVFFRIYFPVNEILTSNMQSTQKKYDCIYFGRLEKSKGSNDFIRVISEIKKVKPDVKAFITGSGNLSPLQTLADKLNCYDNIEFVTFVKSQKELFEYVKASRVLLVPTLKERLPATIRESMMLKIPIVAYSTGGIPYINEFSENIYLVDTGDYKQMAIKTLQLLQDEQMRDQLADKAYSYCINEYSCKINTERLLSAYHNILNNQ
jgi:glycosyltransferase involved in cell wall biosynthesis